MTMIRTQCLDKERPKEMVSVETPEKSLEGSLMSPTDMGDKGGRTVLELTTSVVTQKCNRS